MDQYPITSAHSALLETETGINLTTIARVRAALGNKEVNTADDAWLAIFISLASVHCMRLLRRAFWQKSRNEYFDVLPGQRRFRVLAPPITSAASAIVAYNNTDTPRDFTSSDDLIDTDYILIQGEGRAELGIIDFDTPLVEGPNTLKVTYTGGLAAGADAAASTAIIAAYPTLAGLIDMQVGFMWRRRLSSEIMSQSVVGASTTRIQTGFWDRRVEESLLALYGRG